MENPPPDDISVDQVMRPGAAEDEILAPPGLRRPPTSEQSEAARIMAKWLDDFIKIPGTNFRIGLDPIVSLFPGVGDFLASSAGLVILAEAVRSGVSFFVLIRMAMNTLLNTLIGSVPVAGSIVSAFFKSNSRNLVLLRRWQEGHQDEVKRGTFRLFLAIVFFAACLIALWVGLWMLYIWAFRELLSGAWTK